MDPDFRRRGRPARESGTWCLMSRGRARLCAGLGAGWQILVHRDYTRDGLVCSGGRHGRSATISLQPVGIRDKDLAGCGPQFLGEATEAQARR
jgi:hypothetical protein